MTGRSTLDSGAATQKPGEVEPLAVAWLSLLSASSPEPRRAAGFAAGVSSSSFTSYGFASMAGSLAATVASSVLRTERGATLTALALWTAFGFATAMAAAGGSAGGV